MLVVRDRRLPGSSESSLRTVEKFREEGMASASAEKGGVTSGGFSSTHPGAPSAIPPQGVPKPPKVSSMAFYSVRAIRVGFSSRVVPAGGFNPVPGAEAAGFRTGLFAARRLPR